MPHLQALAIVLALALLPLAAPVLAQDEDAPTKLVLNETATREVEQDTLVAVVTARHEAPDAREAQRAVNQAMAAALEATEAVEGIQRSTGGYRVYQEYDREGRPLRWIAEQDLQLKAREPARLLELVGDLQESGLILNGLSYQLSTEARRALENELTLEAIERLRARAERIAAAMQMRIERIDKLQVGGVADQPPVRPMFEARMADTASMPPPAALPGTETVDVAIEAEVALAPQ